MMIYSSVLYKLLFGAELLGSRGMEGICVLRLHWFRSIESVHVYNSNSALGMRYHGRLSSRPVTASWTVSRYRYIRYSTHEFSERLANV